MFLHLRPVHGRFVVDTMHCKYAEAKVLECKRVFVWYGFYLPIRGDQIYNQKHLVNVLVMCNFYGNRMVDVVKGILEPVMKNKGGLCQADKAFSVPINSLDAGPPIVLKGMLMSALARKDSSDE